MTTGPTFAEFHAAPKCDPALLLDHGELLLDRPVRRWAMPAHRWELAMLAALLVAVIWAGTVTWRLGKVDQIETKVAELLAAHARHAELEQLVGNKEAQKLMRADQVSAAGMPAIEGME